VAKRKALGRGFSALFPDTVTEEEDRGLFYCPIESISPNPHQSRQSFGESELAELAQSIKEKGVIQPILVTKTNDGFQLIAGERRWRAAQKAGLDKIPALIRDVSPAEALQIALIENIQRQDLNPIEEAAAYQELLQRFNFTQDALSARIGKNRTTIANFLRLLKLPDDVQRDIIDGRLSAGHARVLVSIDSPSIQRKIRDLVIKRSLSVRQTEALAKRFLASRRPEAIRDEIDSYLESLVNNLQDSLGTKVAIERKGKKGRIIIEFYSDDELDRLVERLR
jgi:ParB family chromosome partitioning protein